MFLLNLGLVILYCLAVLYIGWRAGKRETPQDFIIASRDVGYFRTTASIFAVLGGEMLIAQAALAYVMGFGAYWFWTGLALGMVFLGLAAPKIKSLGDTYGFINLTEYFGHKWGKFNRYLAALIVFATFFALLALQFIAVGTIVSPLFNISYSIVVIASGLIVLAYLLLGGYKAVIATDLLQAILMFFLFIGLLFFMDIETINVTQSIFEISPVIFISFLAIGIFIAFSSADIWQRIYSAKTNQIARKSLFSVTALFLIFGFAITIVGVVARNHFANLDPNSAFYYGLFQLLPPYLLGAAIVMVLATIMSTIDTEVYLVASSIAKDFIAQRRQLSDAELAKVIGVAMVILSAAAVLFAIFVRDVLSVLFGLASILLSLSPAVIASLFWELKPKAVALSMIGGIAGFLALIAFNQFTPENSVISLPAALIFLVIGQLVFKRRRNPETSL